MQDTCQQQCAYKRSRVCPQELGYCYTVCLGIQIVLHKSSYDMIFPDGSVLQKTFMYEAGKGFFIYVQSVLYLGILQTLNAYNGK